MKRIPAFLILVLIAVLAPIAQSGPQASAQALFVSADGATDVVSGSIVATTSVNIDGEFHRANELMISSADLGSLSGSILIQTPGGVRPDGSVVAVTHQPVFAVGDQVQVAVAPADQDLADAMSSAAGSTLATYSVVGGEEGVHWAFGGPAVTAGVNDFNLTGLFWEDFDEPLNYMINPSNSGLSSSQTVQAVQRAFDAWEDDLASDIRFRYDGITSKTGNELGDGVIVVSWVNGPAATATNTWLAQATYLYLVNGEFVDVDITVNRSFQWADGVVRGKFDIETAIAHEVGHGLGLDHANASSELMYFSIRDGVKKALGLGDLAGVAQLYPTTSKFCGGQVVTVDLSEGEQPTSGPDVILGTPQNDIIFGFGGDDVICGGFGVDRIDGGAGDDIIYGDGGSDRIWGGAGRDELHGGSGADRIWGGPAADKLYGNGGQDRMYGQDGNDFLQGNWESDRLYGGPGDDDLRGAGGRDRLYGEAGNDTLAGGVNTDYLNGGPGFDTGNGQQGRDKPLVPNQSGCEFLEEQTSC